MLWPLFQKWGLSKLQNEILTNNSTLLHRHKLVLLEFKPYLWISKLNLCQEYPFSEILGEKNHSLRQASHQNFRNNPFISLFRQSQAGKRLQSFEVQPGDFPKSISSKLPKFATFSQIITCKQKPSQKYRYVKSWHIRAFGPKLRYFFKPPWKHAP